MADVTGAFEMGTVVAMAGTGTVDATPFFNLGTVVGDTDPSTEETGNGVTYHRCGAVYTEEYNQVTQP